MLLLAFEIQDKENYCTLRHSLEPVIQITAQKKHRHSGTQQPNSDIVYNPTK